MKSTLWKTRAALCRDRITQYASQAVVVISLCTFAVNPAAADPASDVSRLLKAGQHKEALVMAEAFLARHPRDPQMRFLKGVILTEQNKTADAMAMFSKLTLDFPELPEPHNNLAVLYAAAGEYEKARVELDKAIRTNPSYSTAYENLGDIHAKLASQAYDKALQLDSDNATTKSKLTLVRSLVPAAGIANGAKSATSVAAAPVPAPAAKPAARPIEKPPVAVAQAPAKPEPKAEAKSEPKPDAGKSETKPQPAPAKADEAAVMAAVTGWAKAWSDRDVKGYLSFYAGSFDTPPGQSRNAWEKERRARIVDKSRISVEIEEPQVELNGDKATVKFRQIYKSDRLNANSRKTLELTRQGGKWLIVQERTGS